ncbi:putative zinc finger protein [Orchesella cincta]|uniref:Putative zinc finger protein n=1 Tax=Orchesella cincta TaxID=48709 RepID=A0A1D2MGH4_ORCCI|nr:putative zinc finger protein [Orchesella cincta]
MCFAIVTLLFVSEVQEMAARRSRAAERTDLRNEDGVRPPQNRGEGVVSGGPAVARCELCKAVGAEVQILKANYATLDSRTAAEIGELKAVVNVLKAQNASLELKLKDMNRALAVETRADIVVGKEDARVEVQDDLTVRQEGEEGEDCKRFTVASDEEVVEHDDEDDLSTEVGEEEMENEVEILDEPQPPVVCSICEMVLPTKGNLATHMFFHSGVRPFACDICEARFVFIRNLLEHRREHGPRAYNCRDCGKQFGFKKSLKAHQDRDVRCKGRVNQGSRDQEESNTPVE